MLPPTAAIWTTGRARGWGWNETCRRANNCWHASGPSSRIWHHRVYPRRPFVNLWMLGGEIIRDLHEDPSLRKVAADRLLRDVIQYDGGPLLYHGSEEAQRSFDSTCRKLH